MKRFIEFGVLAAALLTLAYLIITFFVQGYLNLSTIFICIGAGVVTGIIVVILLNIFAPGKPILEGEEDKYIKS